MAENTNSAAKRNGSQNENYTSYSATYPFKILIKALLTRDRIKRRSLLNRQSDYLRLSGNPELMKFHAVVNELLEKANEAWDAYDYGQSYFYQGCRELGLTGLRDTEARIQATGLQDLVAGKKIFEVGVNSGFLSIELAKSAQFVTGIEINPHLVAIAERAAEHLGFSNLKFIASSFEDFKCDETFEVVLSLANHSTYDGLTGYSLEDYFEKCHDMLTPDGLLVFESHPEGFEYKGIDHTREVIASYFSIEEERQPQYGTPLDQGRTVMLARRK